MSGRESRRAFLKTAGMMGIGAALSGWAGAAERGRRPNVLFIYTDDQRGDTIGALGNPVIQTPNLDALARSGFVFRNAYCMGGDVGAVCLPARKMVLTGRAWFGLKGQVRGGPRFPVAMNEAGYETFQLGKRGNVPREVQKLFAHDLYEDEAASRLRGRPGEAVADGAIKFLKEREKGKPFFMYLAPGAPHDPRVAPPEYLAKYDVNRIPLPGDFRPFHPFDNGELLVRDEQLAPWPRTEEEIRKQNRDYYAVITYLDEQIGRVIAALKQSGEYENTIIIFTSDQGVAIGEHGLMGKQNLYDSSMRVPVIVSGPGIPKGAASDALCYHFDLLPTVCELVGAEVPSGVDGKGLAAVMRGDAKGVRDAVLLGYRDCQRAVRRGRWKLIRYPRVNVTQLFDLEDDPREKRDLSGEAAQAERMKELLGLMAEQQKLFGDRCPLVVEKPRPAAVDLEFFKKSVGQKKAGA